MILPASAMPVINSAPTPILNIVGNAAVAYSTARRLSSANTSPFVGLTTNNGTSLVGTYTALYNANNEIDINDLTVKIGATQASGISSWTDQSGNNNNASALSVSTAPYFYSVSDGGYLYINTRLASYYLSSVSKRLTLSPITLASEFVVFFVTLPANNNPQLGGGVPNQTNAYFRAGTTTADMAASNQYTTGNNIGSTPQICRAQIIGGVLSVHTNGVNRTLSTLPFTRNNSIAVIGLVNLAPSGALIFEGHLSEVIIYNRFMTTTEINTVESNMRAYYGV